MTSPEKRRSLGRGLSALIPPKPEGAAWPASSGVATSGAPGTPGTAAHRGLWELPIEEVLPGDAQPRQVFHDPAIEELAASIREHGILQPLVVRQRGPQQYEIIAGERRWRAAQRAGLRSVPCVLSEVAEKDTLTLALVENLQRQDLNAIEEADAYHRLHEELGYSQADIARAVGRAQSTVANSLRLLKLPTSVRQQVLDGELSMGHARALLGLEESGDIERMAREALRRAWSVRQTEQAVSGKRGKAVSRSSSKQGGAAAAAPESPAERDVRERLQRALTTQVELRHQGGRGTFTVHFSSFEQLDDILQRIGA